MPQLTATRLAEEATAIVLVPVKSIAYDTEMSVWELGVCTRRTTHRHRNAVSRSTKSAGVGLVNDNTVLLDASRGVARVNNISHGGSGSSSLGLDAESLIVVYDLVVQDLDVLHYRV